MFIQISVQNVPNVRKSKKSILRFTEFPVIGHGEDSSSGQSTSTHACFVKAVFVFPMIKRYQQSARSMPHTKNIRSAKTVYVCQQTGIFSPQTRGTFFLISAVSRPELVGSNGCGVLLFLFGPVHGRLSLISTKSYDKSF